ncbi:hypothetical protein SHELI_v1c05620 [Spiroplasma helicoides]|uniref:SprT-like domain-containing protein n=2 Tax=Spiroplasma helicoides TaxID=216938 RepID=A0A1B3SKS0_9MOLU|nr:hypothetical protein SHELI_v1c05620 [Spiroplasma helicoides]
MIDDLILELSLIHHQINKKLFNKELKKIKINISDNKRLKTKLKLGHFEANSGWEDNDMQIIIWTLALDGDPYNIISVLIHEMVHQWNFQHNIKDVENNGRHNKKFRDKALSIGLEIPKTIRGDKTNKHGRGFDRTNLSKILKDIIKKDLDFNWDILKFKHRNAIEYESKSYSQRYTYYCLCIFDNRNFSFSSSKKMKIKCLICNNEFKIK